MMILPKVEGKSREEKYAGPHAGQPDADGLIPRSDWLLTDPDFGTFRSFLSEAQWAFFRHITRTASDLEINEEPV